MSSLMSEGEKYSKYGFVIQFAKSQRGETVDSRAARIRRESISVQLASSNENPWGKISHPPAGTQRVASQDRNQHNDNQRNDYSTGRRAGVKPKQVTTSYNHTIVPTRHTTQTALEHNDDICLQIFCVRLTIPLDDRISANLPQLYRKR